MTRESSQSEPTGSRSLFVGRDRERHELLAGLDDLCAGRGCLFLLAGEPGIGKTRLADELAAEASSRGVQVVWGRCWEGGGAPAFWPWIQVLRTLAEACQAGVLSEVGSAADVLSKFVPEVEGRIAEADAPVLAKDLSPGYAWGASDPKAERFRLFDSAANFIKRVAAVAPLLLILDDCHAADVGSLLLLRFLAHDLRQTRIMMIITYRTAEVRMSPPLAELIGDLHRDGSTIELRGISEIEARKFIELTSGQRADQAMVESLYRVTEGNPFFLSEIVRLWVAEGPTWRSKTGGFGTFTVPDEVRTVIRRRLELASEPTRSALNVASVIGREFDIDTLSRISTLSADQLHEPLEEAVRSELVDRMPSTLGRYRFRHALLPETLYDDLPRRRRRQLHQEIAQAIEELYQSDLGPHLSVLAHHYLRTLPAENPEKAIDYAGRAAQRAAGLLAYEEAARLYQMAIQALESQHPVDQKKLCELLLLQGDSLYKSGFAEDSRLLFERAAKIARALGSAEDLARAALGIGVLPSDPGVVDYDRVNLAEEALRALGEQDSALRAMLLARLARELYYSEAHERRDALSQTSVEIARRSRDKPTLIYSLINRHVAAWAPDNLQERLDLSTEILELCNEPATKLWIPQGLYLRIVDRVEQGDVDAADLDIGELSSSTEKTWQSLAFRERALAMRALMSGRFEEGERLAHQALALGQGIERRAHFAFTLYLCSLRREQGRFGELESTLRATIAAAPQAILDQYLLALCYCDSDRPAEAKAQFKIAVELTEPRLANRPRTATWLGGMVILAEVCACLGDRDRAPRYYDLLRPYASRNAVLDLNVCSGSVARYLGMLATTMGRFDDAEAQFERGLSFNQKMRAHPFVARTQYNYAAMLLLRDSAGDRARAAELAGAAFETAAELKMADLADRAAQLKAKAAGQPQAVDQRKVVHDAAQEPTVAEFRREGEFWAITYRGETFRVKHMRGLGFIAVLLHYPNTEFHSLDLTAEGGAPEPDAPTYGGAVTRDAAGEDGGASVGPGDAGEMLDPEAKLAYRRRLTELRESLEDAKELRNSERVAEIESEIDALTRELARAVGLGGRDRRSASASERARVNVTRAIKAGIERISESNAALGRLLANSIRTGTFCSYVPNPGRSAVARPAETPAAKVDAGSIEALAAAAVAEPRELRAHAAPDGTISILFSDVVDSSPLFERLGDLRAQQILSAHNAIIREQVALQKGFEVKSMGDGFMIAFSSARRAVLCAIGIQRAFAKYREQHRDEPIQVRIGLHVGETISESADFSGKAVILAARIAAIAQGGEILVSSTMHELASSAGDLRFTESGEVKLKGLSGTHRLYRAIW